MKSNSDYLLVKNLIANNAKTRDTHLNLSHCGIEDLYDFPELFELEHLEELLIGNEMWNEVSRTWVVMSGRAMPNTINKIPKEIQNLRKLSYLSLNGLPLKGLSIFQNLKGLQNLNSLDLGRVHLDVKACHDLADNLPHIKQLNLRRTNIAISQLQTIGKKIAGLEYFSVSGIPIGVRGISLIVKYMPNLIDLAIWNCKVGIGGFKAIASDLKRIEALNIGQNFFGDEGLKAVSSIKGLKRLYVPNNNITTLSPLMNCENLTELWVNSNPIKLIEPISRLKKLISLNLNNCPVTDCPADIWQTHDIKQIRAFFDRKQTKIEKSVQGSKGLDSVELQVDLNRVKTKRRAVEKVRDRDVKLILLGNSNAGKTTLLNFLNTGKFKEKRSTTHGLQVVRWEPDLRKFPLLKDIAVSVWDFGGQEYYHEAYKLFLSANAAYVVVWCKESNVNGYRDTLLRYTDKKKTKLAHFELEYWLDTVKHTGMYSDSSDLFLVQTKTDMPQNEKARVNQLLHDDYGIKESFHLSLKEGCNPENKVEQQKLKLFANELEKLLYNAADKSSYPVVWLQIRSELLKLEKGQTSAFSKILTRGINWVNLDVFLDSCENFVGSMLTDDEKYTLPRWLDRSGVAVYFPDNEILMDRIFLNPKKLSDKIYSKLTEELLGMNGEIEFNHVRDEVLRQLLLSLDLIFPHPSSNGKKKYIVPQYLPEKHAIEDLFKIASDKAWQASIWLKVPMYFYKKVLNGLIFHYSKTENADARYFWKHGILFMKSECRILIKGLYPDENQREGKILISVENGENRTQIEQEIFGFSHRAMLKAALGIESQDMLPNIESLNLSNSKIGKESASEKMNKRLYVSCDNQNYATYFNLLKAADAQESYVIAECDVELNENNTQKQLKYLPIKPFASILPERNLIDTKKVFLSYSHQNAHWLNRLRVHLSGLKHSKFIEDWTDQEILPGEIWDDKIRDQIEQADLFILLLSADFVASDYIWKTELPEILKKKKGKIIPVLIEPFDFSATSSISEKEMIPKQKIKDDGDGKIGEKLLAVSLWKYPELALTEVAATIRALVTS